MLISPATGHVSSGKKREHTTITLSDSSDEDCVDLKVPSLPDTHFAATQMLPRVIARGRKQVTSIVRNLRVLGNEEDKDGEINKLKVKKKKLKMTLNAIESAEKDGNGGVRMILSVTNNGEDILDDADLQMGSQDVLDFLTDYCDDE